PEKRFVYDFRIIAIVNFKIFLRHLFGEHQGIAVRQQCIVISSQEFIVEHFEKVVVSKNGPIATKHFVFDFDIDVAARHHAGIRFNLGEVPGHHRTDGGIHDGTVLDELAILKTIVGNTIGTVYFFVELVVTQFIAYKLEDEQTRGQTGSQSEDVDGRKYPVFQQVAHRDGEVTFQHWWSLWLWLGTGECPEVTRKSEKLKTK